MIALVRWLFNDKTGSARLLEQAVSWRFRCRQAFSSLLS